ncbi:anti-sigma factor domain-containing protein [Paenibacillus sp. NPDC056579]|uniref:anti-sigma-I factor RsgI family protein n=1 Tax=Paenibacillus sp. NPDC056579 TaxID=3345871 RepID=UPI0036BB89B4
MNKGIVMEMTDRSIIVMRQDGKFDKISRKNRSCEIGEEIIYAQSGVNWRSPSVAGRSAFVAAVVFCLVLFASFAGRLGSSEVVAYVSLDINPSVEMGIDEKKQVLELRGLNDDGSALIQEVNYKGKTLENVTASLLDKAEQKSLAKGEASIVIASSVVTEKSSVNDAQIAEKLRQQVTDHIKLTHPEQVSSYQVEAFAAPQEVREEASKSGVSMGKYTVYLNAKSNGIDVKIDDLKKESIHQIVKNNPENKTAVVQPDKTPTKSDIRKWIEEERSGELDKKLQEKKKEQDTKSASSSKNDAKKPGTNGSPTTSSISNNGNNNNNNNNSRNNTGTNSRDNDKNNRNDKDDDDKDSDRKDDKKPSSSNSTNRPGTSVPVVRPGASTPPSKPGTPTPGTSRPGSDNKNDRGDDRNKEDDNKRDDSKNNDTKKNDVPPKVTPTPPPKKDDAKKEDDRKRAEEERLREEAKRVEEQKNLAEKKKEEERKKEQEKKAEDNKKEDSKDDNGKKSSDNQRDSNDRNDNDNNDRRR